MGVPIVESCSVAAGDSETLDTKVMAFAEECLGKVRSGGAAAVYEYAIKFGEVKEGESAVVLPAAMKAVEKLSHSALCTRSQIGRAHV